MTIWEVHRMQTSLLPQYVYKQIHYRNKLFTWPDSVGERKCRQATVEVVSDRKRTRGLMYNTVIQLYTTMMTPFNVAKDRFVVLCSTAVRVTVHNDKFMY